ncbi:probable ubiquitin-like-specific protease 2B isoform X3 [Mangifera indica]|uniref:probable ubiquitin-like-specific protease 2B isoform X3 n=1 Tax=Mangifera indica TaxID=29780 RepID=UPI001CFC2ED1|nr:probable ubiquitin-like-specific protease 2B isoform X3 [Mangifera indica]
MENGHQSFDFKEEDELTEYAAGNFVTKYHNPNHDNYGVLKYDLLECGTDVQKQGIGGVLCVNVDAVDSDPSCDNGNTYTSMDTDREDFVNRATLVNSTSCEENPSFRKDNCGTEIFSCEMVSGDSFHREPLPGKSHFNCGYSDSPSNGEPVAVNSDVEGSMDEGSPLSPFSDTMEENACCITSAALNGHVSDHCLDDMEMDDTNMTVVICPDYVVYRDDLCSVCHITFSCTGIKIKNSTASENQGRYSWGIDDIVDIECQWFQKVASVVVKLHLLSKNSIQDDDDSKGTSGIEELKFAVIEQNWSEKQEKITSLNDKYRAVWNIVFDGLAETNGNDVFERRQYFPNESCYSFDEPFEDVIYPKGDSDAVSISKRDVDLLQPETFINDTIIDFYIKYLKNQIQAEEKHRFHFFNSFFFRKLADLDKDPSSISDGKAAFLRVHKWTRKVDVFGKDYIFIPVNFNLHWSLLIICHLGEVATFRDEDMDNSEKVPCILHMDSIKGTHAGLKNLVQSYLWEEWKVRHKDTSEDISSKFLNMRFVQLELPQQENSFDCGLFLLHYLELFLAEAPVNFSPFKLTKFSNFLNVDWFPPSEASLKRTLIQKLIFELLENRSREVTSDVCHNEHQSSRFPKNSENETGGDYVSERCCSSIAQHGNLSNSQTSRGIEITLLGAASARNLQCVNDSGMVLREFFEPGATAGALLTQFQSFGQPSSYYPLNGAISAKEQDDVETGEDFGYLPSGENSFQQIAELTAQASTIPYPSRGFGTEVSWNQEIPMQGEQDVDSSPETSLCASDDSEDVGIIEHNPLPEDASQSLVERTDQRRSISLNIGYLTGGLASVSGAMLQTSTIEGSPEPDKTLDSILNIGPSSGEKFRLPQCLRTLIQLKTGCIKSLKWMKIESLQVMKWKLLMMKFLQYHMESNLQKGHGSLLLRRKESSPEACRKISICDTCRWLLSFSPPFTLT